jgi:hypothetical protein
MSRSRWVLFIGWARITGFHHDLKGGQNLGEAKREPFNMKRIAFSGELAIYDAVCFFYYQE